MFAPICLLNAKEKKVALVVGVSKYENGWASLQCTLNDVKLVQEKLKELGFSIDTLCNPKREEFEKYVNKFVDKSKNSNVAVFYFSGHGFYEKGDYIALKDTPLDYNRKNKAYEINGIAGSLKAERNYLFLDCCRDAVDKGMQTVNVDYLNSAVQQGKKKKTWILYATEVGNTAVSGSASEKYSPFTASLVNHWADNAMFKAIWKSVCEEVYKKCGRRPQVSSELDDYSFCDGVVLCNFGGPNSHRLIKKEGKYGIVDKDNNVIVKPTYDDACTAGPTYFGYMEETDYLDVCVDGKYGYVDWNGKVVIPLEYDWVDGNRVKSDGSFLSVVKKNGKFGVINGENQVVIPFEYECLEIIYSYSARLIYARKAGKYGYLDYNGRCVIPFVYDDAGFFENDLAPVSQNGKYGYINSTGEIKIPLQYEYASDFSSGLAAVVQNGKMGYIDMDGVTVIKCLYDAKYVNYAYYSGTQLTRKGLYFGSSFVGQMAAVSINGSKLAFINKMGEFLTGFDYDKVCKMTSSSACVTKQLRKIYLDRCGNEYLDEEEFKRESVSRMAEQGDKQAMFQMGESFYRKKEYSKAYDWYLKAANLGYVEAYQKLGDLFYYSGGIKLSFEDALQWYQKYVQSPYARYTDECYRKIGRIYFHGGHGVPQSFAKSLDAYGKSNTSEAYYTIGGMYETGNYIEKNLDKALENYKKAGDYKDATEKVKLLSDRKKVSISCINSRASVYFDGEYVGKSTVSLLATKGKHSFALVPNNKLYDEYNGTLDVRDDCMESVRLHNKILDYFDWDRSCDNGHYGSYHFSPKYQIMLEYMYRVSRMSYGLMLGVSPGFFKSNHRSVQINQSVDMDISVGTGGNTAMDEMVTNRYNGASLDYSEFVDPYGIAKYYDSNFMALANVGVDACNGIMFETGVGAAWHRDKYYMSDTYMITEIKKEDGTMDYQYASMDKSHVYMGKTICSPAIRLGATFMIPFNRYYDMGLTIGGGYTYLPMNHKCSSWDAIIGFVYCY